MNCLKVLKANGARITPQRKLIVDVIRDLGADLTIKDLIRNVQKQMPGVNVSTIYRTLDLLEGTGCIYRNKTTDHVVHCHLDDDHHQSLVCRECGKTIYCNERTFASLEKSLLRKYDFQVNFKQGAITGLCGECQSKTK